MNVSTETFATAQIVGEQKAIEYIAKAGFDAYDLSMFNMIRREGAEIFAGDHPLGGKDYIKHVKMIRRVAEDNGIFCNQSHAPYYGYMDKVGDFIKMAIECASEVGAKTCVVHPDAFAGVEEVAEKYFKILPFAKEHGVKILTENIWNMVNGEVTPIVASNEKSMRELLGLIDDEYFGVCLDVGHAEMQGVKTSAVKLIKDIGGRLCGLHIHDNDLIHDQHIMPGNGKIDFHAIVKALKENNYKGEFTLEADRHLIGISEEKVFEELKNLYASVKRLADEFESL